MSKGKGGNVWYVVLALAILAFIVFMIGLIGYGWGITNTQQQWCESLGGEKRDAFCIKTSDDGKRATIIVDFHK